MFKYSSLILIFSILPIFNQCRAQVNEIDNQSKSGIEVRADIYKKMTDSKSELDKIYEESIEFLDSVGTSESENYKSFIIQSQNGWEIYCEGKCKISEYESRAAAQGGFAFYNLCMTELNKIRTDELKEWLKELKREFDN